MNRELVALLGVAWLSLSAVAQKENFGLREKQPKEQLPVSKAEMRDRQTKARILPAYFSDGWFNLLPGETREVQYSGAAGEIIATVK